MKLNLFVLILCAVVSSIVGRALEVVSDDDLLHLIKTEDNVVVLFTKNNCNGCDELESVLENLHDDLSDNLRATVVKAHNSIMVGIYDPTKEPSLVYFRRGIPLLYHGNVNEDEILQMFTDNQEPVVKELSDANFEHLTQASTGATTGDWLLFFYSNDCVPCQRLYAIWESVGASLKRRLNIARVNRLEAGISTAKRFGVGKSPDFIFIRQGKFYRYKTNDYSPAALINFAEGGYGKEKGAPVPPLASPMNEYITGILNFFSSQPLLFLFGAVGFGLTAAIALLTKWFSSKKTKTVQKTKKAK